MKTWYPNVKLSTWLRLYPTFKQDLPMTCICGKSVEDVTPFITTNCIGISTGDCPCGAKNAETISIARKGRDFLDVKDLLLLRTLISK